MLFSIEEIEKLSERIKKTGKSIVFTNGVFDILHRGHVEYLIKAKEMGDILIVGINDDRSVKRLKGSERPVNGQFDRAFIIDSLRSVDHTVIFSEDTPYNLIQKIKPDILVKGGDYDPEITETDDNKYIVGSDIVRSYNGNVATIELVPGRSTTGTINKITEVK